jgi:site-specific DNA recombinase
VDGKLADVNAVVYLRLSEDRTGQEAGVRRQREDCERRCHDRGWTIVAVESDNDISAAGKRKRPGFEAMLTRIESGEAQVVVAWSLDRLQRNRRDEVRLYELCQKAGAQLSLVNGADLDFTSAAGRFVADALGSVARLEIEMKSDRQRRAQLQAAEAGQRVGGRRPFGYEPDGMTVRGLEARAIKAGYTAVLAGEPIAEVAREWNARGLTTGQTGWKGERKGVPSPHTPSSVRDVLRNPRNAGLRAHRGEILGPASWPAIVDESTWRAVVDLLADPRRRTGGNPSPSARALLTGTAVCGVCGSTVHAGGTTRPGVRNYRCSGALGHVGRAAAPVDEFVGALMVARLSQPDARELFVHVDHPDIDALRSEATALRVRLDTLAVEFADGALTPSQLRAATGRMRSQLAEIEARMADAGRVGALAPLVLADDVQVAWDGLSTARQRSVIDLLARVVLHPVGRGTRTFRPETVGIEWRDGVASQD